MLFNSYEFIFLYLPVVFFVFFCLGKWCGQQVATFWLVLASVVFYGWWDHRYVPILVASICFNYFIGGQIRKGYVRKGWLTFGIVGNLMLLGYFKYTEFFSQQLIRWRDIQYLVLHILFFRSAFPFLPSRRRPI